MQLAHKGIKTMIRSMFKDLKEKLAIMRGWAGRLSRKAKTTEKSHTEILKLK